MGTALVADQELDQELAPGQQCRNRRAMAFLPSGCRAVIFTKRCASFEHVIPQPFKMLYDLTAIDERGTRLTGTVSPPVTSRLSITCSPTNATHISG